MHHGSGMFESRYYTSDMHDLCTYWFLDPVLTGSGAGLRILMHELCIYLILTLHCWMCMWCIRVVSHTGLIWHSEEWEFTRPLKSEHSACHTYFCTRSCPASESCTSAIREQQLIEGTERSCLYNLPMDIIIPTEHYQMWKGTIILLHTRKKFRAVPTSGLGRASTRVDRVRKLPFYASLWWLTIWYRRLTLASNVGSVE